MTYLDNTKAFISDTWDKATKAIPESTVVGLVGAGLAMAGIAFKIQCFAINPIAAGAFCAATHLLKNALIKPLCQKFIGSKANADNRTMIPFVTSLAVTAYAIGTIFPLLAVDFAKGTITYTISLLTLNVIANQL